ncbi:EAL domain-containing protein [Oceanimonas baumannii]|uniref:EAL domain-containing protein n=1 Tax=Oceanimonas baumannii TaxID=129578 RepID=UPI003A918A1D
MNGGVSVVAAFRSLKVALVLMLLPFLFLALSVPILVTPLTKYLLQQKMQEIDSYLERRASALDRTIMAQLAGLKFDCSEQDMQLLRAPQYYSRYIRLIGIKNALNISCSSVGLAVDNKYIQSPASDGFTLLNTPLYAGTESEFLVHYQQQGNVVFWVLDSSWSRELLETPCSDCFYLSFDYTGTRLDTLQRGNPAIPNEDASLLIQQDFIHQSQPLVASVQQLWGGQALRNHAHGLLWWWGCVISLALGTVLAAGYLYFRRYRNTLRGLIEQGIKDGGFIPYYQPVVDSRSQRIVGYEVLVRWQKGSELIPPDQFIPVAESEGLIVEITMQLLRRVLDDLERLDTAHWVSINLVAEHVETDCLVRWLQARNWPWPDRIKFELTERTPIKSLHHADRHISSLIKRGYQFKIDDFGTGYGGFVYLQQLSIEGIKIDKMFIDTIGTNDVKSSVLDSIISSAHQTNMTVIAEGVETPAQITYLAQRQVFLIQGYVFYRPMPISGILMLRERGAF